MNVKVPTKIVEDLQKKVNAEKLESIYGLIRAAALKGKTDIDYYPMTKYLRDILIEKGYRVTDAQSSTIYWRDL